VGQQVGEEGAGREDFDAKGFAQVEQVRVSRHDELGVCGQRGGKIGIVFGVPASLLAQRGGFNQRRLGDEPIQRRPRIAAELRSLPLDFGEGFPPFRNDALAGGGLETAPGERDQAQVRLGSPATIVRCFALTG